MPNLHWTKACLSSRDVRCDLEWKKNLKSLTVSRTVEVFKSEFDSNMRDSGVSTMHVQLGRQYVIMRATCDDEQLRPRPLLHGATSGC